MSGTSNVQDSSLTILSAGDMSGNLSSSVTDLQGTNSYSVQAVYTGAPVGTLQLQISMDNITFSEYTGSSVSISEAGNTMFKITRNGERYIKAIYTFSSGTGSLSAIIGLQG